MKNKLTSIVLLCLLPLTGCVGGAEFNTYVRADRQYVNAQHFMLRDAVNTNPSLTDMDKATLKRQLDAKEKQVHDAELLLGIVK